LSARILIFENGGFFPITHPVADVFNSSITAATRYCAVYGHPVKHSASPAMQNAGFANLGLDWRYLAFDVYALHLREAILGAQMMGFIGLNLTVPHKQLAFDMVDALDASAQQWRAVNTILFEARDEIGEWHPLHHYSDRVPGELRSRGFNTDADAFAMALQEEFDLRLEGSKVLVLGAGGAGQVAARKLASQRVSELYLVNRTIDRAEALADRLQHEYPDLKVEVAYPPGPVDLLVNATSLGMHHDDPLPFDEDQFDLQGAPVVYDLVYRPAVTPLLRAAKAAGSRVANGLGILLHQGARALEIWTGRPAPLWAMREALEKDLYGPQSQGR
jgi:shikimate dehydrogenase